MTHSIQHQIIALAGILQAAALVKQLASKGVFDEKSAITSIKSLFTINANSIEEIYGDVNNLKLGLEELINLFDKNKKQNKDQEIARYTFSLIYVERCLMKNQNMIDIIQQGITRTESQLQVFQVMHDNIMANLAGIYTDTVSTLNFRIHVTGEQNYLTNINNTNRIRAFLLAGLRAAVLWRQIGGSRWQLIFSRQQIVDGARGMLMALAIAVK